MSRRLLPSVLLLPVLGGLLAGTRARAEWIDITSEVPVERLVANLEKRLEAHQDDAQAHYVLGRVHSLAWARGGATVHVVSPREDEAEALPGFAPWDSVRVSPPTEPESAERREHYRQSVLHYRRATGLDPKDALAWLGLGWMLEKGLARGAADAATAEDPAPEPTAEERARFEAWVAALASAAFVDREAAAKQLADALPRSLAVLRAHRDDPAPEIRARVASLLTRHARDLARDAYRHAFDVALEGDMHAESFGVEGDTAISLEAGRGLLRLLDAEPASEADAAERKRVAEAVENLEAKPRWITPVVFPLDGSLPLSGLLGGRTARFDLAGLGEPQTWPWVGPRTGILVWDPAGTGRVTSGRQLFGSVTWWLFWRSGYEALAALDDDGDGTLAGAELEGIAVWTDADGDAVSDPGEVVPASSLGVVAIAVRPRERHAGAPSHPAGLRLRDGTTRPTWDWTPREVRAR